MPFPIHTESLPLLSGPKPNTDLVLAQQLAQVNLKPNLQFAPLSLEEWVGREQLLAEITQDWVSPQHFVTGLIGFGGEGKTSLARRWVTELRLNRLSYTPRNPKPDGIFWWGFYERNSVDEFFEAALNYLSAGQVDLSRLPSASARANFLAGMLRGKRYLFILDGFEVMQQEQGDEYAQLKSADLYDFLTYFAAGGHESFCLITSRAPLLDLIEFTSYTNRNVDRLSDADGRALLQKIGVRGEDSQLDRIVSTWDGHALTLSLLGSYLVDRYQGDITHVADIPTPSADEDCYQRVQRVLRRYDEHLTEAEQIFLKIFSAFRLPVQQSAFKQVFRDKTTPQALNAPLTQLSPPDFKALIQQLIKYRILRFNPRTHYYKLHPLIQNHYCEQLKQRHTSQLKPLYRSIKNYYLGQAVSIVLTPTLDSLTPLLEVVHFVCQIEAYDTAWQIYWERISQRNRYVLIAILCAYETTIATLKEFFPNGDTAREPLVTSAQAKYLILEEIGICWAGLGYLSSAQMFYERAKVVVLNAKNWEKTSLIYQRLSELHVCRGELAVGKASAQEAFDYATRAKNSWTQMESLVYQAIVADLQGNLDTAEALFLQAEARQQKMQNDTRHLFSWRGIAYANFLNRAGHLGHAEAVAQENLQICQEKGWLNLVGKANRTLGDILNGGRRSDAGQYYDTAVKVARSTPRFDALIEALCSRGQWSARYGDLKTAHNDLAEALRCTTVNSYHLYEADVRVGLAWLHHAEGNNEEAIAEAAQAKQMSQRMGYYWGAIAADEILEKLGG
jgi:tetratricopeptide (TPR) repeat protein